MISILGAGSIGQLLAHKLTDASVDCQFIVRDRDQYDEKHWTLDFQGQQFKRQFSVISSESIEQTQALDMLWICVKAPQLESALQSVAHCIHEQTEIVLFQNGMGHEQITAQFVSSQRIFFASNTHGAYRAGKQKVVYAGQGKIDFGALQNSAKPQWLTPAMLDALNADWSTNIEAVLWRKLLINALINPLTAIYQCPNGELLKKDKQLKLLNLIDENRQFAEILKLPFAKDLKALTLQVIEQTADNQSSMLQDIQKNQITEIEAINGYLLEQMSKRHFKATHNWSLWSEFHILYPPLKSKVQNRVEHLSAEQFHITQQKGTERPFSGNYNIHNQKGQYLCAICDSVLFDDHGKFDSGCGWPSFDRAQNNKAIVYQEDFSHGMNRIEILCAQCGSHLGHVFEDGPTATGQRYCVNSLSLEFKPNQG